jgi:hypothetical protein
MGGLDPGLPVGERQPPRRLVAHERAVPLGARADVDDDLLVEVGRSLVRTKMITSPVKLTILIIFGGAVPWTPRCA